ncbi:MAG: hypothetical protein H6810_04950 [Phycisphaeraceae bacterium]|nr:MAG: hypothetical protein H6810_04950 [Phycisphaeraceae bacterium]
MTMRMTCPIAMLGAAACGAGAQSSLVDSVVWPVADGGNGHRYALTDTPAPWTATEAFAASRGGHLASVNTTEENEFLRQAFLTGAGAGEDFWVGFTCPAPLDFLNPDNWEWVDGSAVSFTNWRPGQPDFWSAEDRYIAVNNPHNGTMVWDNYPDSLYRILRGIVEIPACNPADLAEPFGLLDLADVNAFIAGFLGGDPIADLNTDGLFDLDDVLLYVDAFMTGCI